MRDGFSAVIAVIDDEAKALVSVADSEFGGDFSGGEEECTKRGLILRLCLTNAGNDFLRDDQDVRRGLWLDIVEGGAEVVFIDERGWDLPGDDFFEDGFFAHGRELAEKFGMIDAAAPTLVEGLDFADELTHVLELAIYRGVADVGDVVEIFEFTHDLGADDLGGNLPVPFLLEFVGDLVHGELDFVHGNGAFLAGLEKAGQELVPGEGLAAAVALHDVQFLALDDLIGGESEGALEALATAADGMTVPGFA